MHEPARDHQRPLGLGQHRRHPVDIACVRRHPRPFHRVQHRRLDRLVQHVLRQRDHDRARRAGGGEMEGARCDLGDHLRGIDLEHRLGRVGKGFRVVHLLQRQPALLETLDLADEEDRRDGVMKGAVDRDRDVRGARSAADEAYPGLAADTRVRERHEAGAAFMPADDQTDVRMLDQRVGHGEIALARNAIGNVDTVCCQCRRQELGSRLRHAFPPGLELNGPGMPREGLDDPARFSAYRRKSPGRQ